MSYTYTYTKATQPDIDWIHLKIPNSSMSNKNIQSCGWNSGTQNLDIEWDVELSSGDKTILDSIVDATPDYEPAGSPTTMFSSYNEMISWDSKDGYNFGGNIGNIQDTKGTLLRLYVSNVTNYESWIYTKDKYNIFEASKEVQIEVPVLWLSSQINQNIWLHFCTAVLNPVSDTAEHFGWKIAGKRLHTSCANGTNQTITDTSYDLKSWDNIIDRLRIVFVPTESIKYFVNDFLLSKHTTNLPTAASMYLHFNIKTLENAAKEIHIGRIQIGKQY